MGSILEQCMHAKNACRLAEKAAYQRVGEATEVALRVLAEKIGLPGYAQMPQAVDSLSKQDRASFCNNYWQEAYSKVLFICLSLRNT